MNFSIRLESVLFIVSTVNCRLSNQCEFYARQNRGLALTFCRIMFMREFDVIDSAMSVEQLRMRLKEKDFEKFGDPFIPEFVYEVIKRLPRFSSMRVSLRVLKWAIGESADCRYSVATNKMPKSLWASCSKVFTMSAPA